MSPNARHSSVLQDLRARLRQMDHSRGGSQGAGALSSTGVAALDTLLPPGTFRAGMIVEWIVEGAGSGAARLVFPMVLEAITHPEEWVAGAGPKGSPGERLGTTPKKSGALVVIDERREFYPPAAASQGLDLDRTIVVRPRHHQETIWALEQALSCAGVAATLGWIDKISDRVFRRFQLAAEHGAGLGLLMRPSEARHEPTWADIRWLVRPVPADANGLRRREEASPMQAGVAYGKPKDVLCDGGFSSGRRVRVELLHCRGGTGGGAVTLEISDETGAVSMVPPLAAPANLPRAAGA